MVEAAAPQDALALDHRFYLRCKSLTNVAKTSCSREKVSICIVV
jgi:hypothetical protein